MEKIWDNIVLAISNFSIFNLIDIILLGLIVYAVLIFLKKNYALRLVKYIIFFILLSSFFISKIFPFPMMSLIFQNFVMVLFIGLVLLFPQEIRRILRRMSSQKEASNKTTNYDCSDEELKATISEIIRAVQNMAKNDVGALLVVVPNSVPPQIIESGIKMDSYLSCNLLECIFNTKAPLHDGAVLIKGNKIMAAGCFLPLSQDVNIAKELGTRHRAALGMTENSDVMTIIVSEETGVISVAKNGRLTRYYDSSMLKAALEQAFGLKAHEASGKKKKKSLSCSK